MLNGDEDEDDEVHLEILKWVKTVFGSHVHC